MISHLTDPAASGRPAPAGLTAGDQLAPLAGVLEGWLERPLPTLRRDVVEALERGYLDAQLERSGGRVGEAARRAGLDPRVLYDKMRLLGLRKEDFRQR